MLFNIWLRLLLNNQLGTSTGKIIYNYEYQKEHFDEIQDLIPKILSKYEDVEDKNYIKQALSYELYRFIQLNDANTYCWFMFIAIADKFDLIKEGLTVDYFLHTGCFYNTTAILNFSSFIQNNNLGELDDTDFTLLCYYVTIWYSDYLEMTEKYSDMIEFTSFNIKDICNKAHKRISGYLISLYLSKQS